MANVWLGVRDTGLLFLISWLGWKLLEQLKVPAASLLGGVTAVGLARLLGVPFAYLPWFLQLMLQAVLGIFIGLRFTKDTWPHIKNLALPAILVSVWMLASCFLVGRVFQRLTQVAPVTAILGAAPGGVAEMTMLALNLNADAVVVATLQLMRLLGVVFVIPLLALRQTETSSPNNNRRRIPKIPWQPSAVITLTVGIIGGIVAYILKLPAAGLLGAMVTVGLISGCFHQLTPLPDEVRVWTQAGVGALIGLNFGPETVQGLMLLAGPAITSTAVVIVSGLVLATLLQRLTGWDYLTCLLAAAPGGVTQFFILACELGADPLTVSLLQLVRFVTILGILPLLLSLPLWS